MRKNRKIILTISCLLLGVPTLLAAQNTTRKAAPGEPGIIEHHESSGTLSSVDARPLLQAIDAISTEYGWVIDFEDPPYRSSFDLMDSTDPKWRADHPNEKGIRRIAGGPFQSSFPEPSSLVSGNAEEQVLQKIVSDYNSSGNPGRFVVRKEAEGRYAVIGAATKSEIGQDETATVLLDTPITIPVAHRSAYETLDIILKTLSSTAGVKVYASLLSVNHIQEPDIVVGGSNVPARALLLQALDAANKHRIIRWDLLFDPNMDAYALRVTAASKAVTDDSGIKAKAFIDRK